MGETTNAARQATTTGSATESAAEDEALFPWVANHVEQVVDPSPIDSMDERWDARIVREVAFMRRQKLRESSGMPAWLRFFLDIYDEWQMIDWPSPQRTFRILVVSIIFLVLAMAYIYSLDSVFGWLSSILFEK
jgi:preprotein translocase SecE subunit